MKFDLLSSSNEKATTLRSCLFAFLRTYQIKRVERKENNYQRCFRDALIFNGEQNEQTLSEAIPFLREHNGEDESE